jgi:hypothetical protein
MNDGQPLAAKGPGRRDMTQAYRRPGGLAVLVAAAAIGLAACTSGSSNPQVASLPTSSHGGGAGPAATGNAATTGAAGNPTQLLNQWAACMRRLGDTSQATPTVDANKVIHVVQPTNFSALGLGGQSGGSNSCSTYMNAASKALGGGNHGQPGSNTAQWLKFAKCMRAHGVADFPDPGSNGLTNIPPDSGTATFQSATKTCQAQVGLKPTSGATIPGSVIYSTAANG